MERALAAWPGELDHYLAQIDRIPLLSLEEERELAIRYFEHGDLEAAQRLISANLRFVVRVAHQFARSGCSLADLVQEGNLGLMLAVRRYNPHRGYRLISYAIWWIRSMMYRFVLRTWSVVQMGTTRAARKLFPRRQRATEAVEADRTSGRSGTRVAELAAELGVTDAEVLEMELRFSARDFSLDARVLDEEGGLTHLDLLADGAPSPEERLSEHEMRARARQEIERAIAQVPARDRTVIRRRVLSEDPPSLAMLAQEMGVSRERVRQIEASGLDKLKAAIISSDTARELVA